MSERWEDSVREKRDILETWADSDLPLADEMKQLLKEADAGGRSE